METARQIQPPSKLRITLTWLLMLGMILFWLVFWVWHNHGRVHQTDENGSATAHTIVTLFIGGFFLVPGVLGYLIATFTGCLCFSYAKPVWPAAKVRKYFVNIAVTVLLGLGVGFILSAFTTPFLAMMGLDQGVAFMLPVMLTLGVIQILQLWVLMWSPMERQLIVKRLEALGIKSDHLNTGWLVGLSDPASGMAKRFASIEEDLGALWVGPEQLIYWGDGEQFSISRAQIAQIERKADTRSTTMLAGIQHVILHVQLPDGNVRQIRLHVEGQATMGGKRRTMDALANAINQWYHASAPA